MKLPMEYTYGSFSFYSRIASLTEIRPAHVFSFLKLLRNLETGAGDCSATSFLCLFILKNTWQTKKFERQTSHLFQLFFDTILYSLTACGFKSQLCGF